MTNTTSGKASGKVILFGEHAVVYGTPAIAAGLDRGASASASFGAHGPSVLRLGDREIHADVTASDDLARAFGALLGVAPAAPSVVVNAESALPAGGGLGSSAAIGVAIGRAVEKLVSGSEVDDVIETRALERAAAWERVLHGNPSGIDAAAAAQGGLFRYTRAEGARPLSLGADLVLCVGSTGKPSSTREMVELVAARRAKDPTLVQRSIDAIGAIVNNAALAMEAGDRRAVGELMNMNQLLLSGLFVSTSELEDLCALARSAGALGAKLTGGGGGGCVIALVSPEGGDVMKNAERILDSWRTSGGGYEGFVARISADGQEAPAAGES